MVDDPRHAAAERITLVCDNLNTHAAASFYKAFPPEEAHRLACKIELIYTPKHGSWLNTSECELSALTRQCLGGRIARIDAVRSQAAAWAAERNARQTGVNWQFTTEQARVRLRSLCPQPIL